MASSDVTRAAAFPKLAVVLALGLSLLPSAVQGIAFEARATPVFQAEKEAAYGVSPAVTAAPELRDLMVLAKRASQGTDTCGYIDGNYNEYVTCIGRQSCTFASSGLGCCSGTGTAKTCGGWVSTCYDFTSVGTACSTCTNSAATYCSNSARAWCATYHYPGSILDFICSSAPATLNMQFAATTTYAPQNHNQPIPNVSGTPVATLPSASGSSSSNSSSNSSSYSYLGGLLVWQIALIGVAGFLVICSLFSCCCWRTIRRRRQRVVVVQQPPVPMQSQQGYYPQQAYPDQTYYPPK